MRRIALASMAPLLMALVPLAIVPAAIAVARAQDVDVALVLVTDVSRSIDDREFALEKDGYGNAFTSQKVLDAIQGGSAGKIAVAYVEFAGSFEVRTVLDWTVIADKASARAFATRLNAAPRSFFGRTAISAGVDQAMQLFAETAVNPARRVIDVCGDGTNNAGRDVAEARNDAVKAGITINGLAIINDHPASWTFAHVQPAGGLANYYRDNVAGGPGSFVLEVHDFANFGEAMTRKLVDEIAGAPSSTRYAGGH
ncbi:MAG TPA: hypothetical protein DDZ81_12520 [Acetobacteraceae bacterium]|jgi:hypothetical protein|nr:hypothetical protein [Acetobacteraceae bacterium]